MRELLYSIIVHFKALCNRFLPVFYITVIVYNFYATEGICLKQEARKDFLISTLYFFTVSAIVFIVCRFLLKYLTPFVVGGAIAWLVQKPAKFISGKTRIKRKLAAAGLALAVFLLAAGLCVFLVLRISSGISNFAGEVSGYAEEISAFFEKIKKSTELFFSDMPEELSTLADSFFKKASDTMISAVTGFVSDSAAYIAGRMPGILLSCIVSAVAACYIAADFPSLIRFARGVIGSRVYGNIRKVKEIFVTSVFKLGKGYAILMLMTFAELLAGFYLLGIKHALLLAALTAMIDILPVLGTGTVLVPWAAVLFILGDIGTAGGIIVLYAVITVIRNFAEPRIIGGQMGINPLFTLLAMFIGIKLFGVAGIFLLPVALIVTVKYYKDEMESETEK